MIITIHTHLQGIWIVALVLYKTVNNQYRLIWKQKMSANIKDFLDVYPITAILLKCRKNLIYVFQ